jgi:cell division septation protein DedD
MDNRVRDLDQIQEQDGDDRARRLGTVLMATIAIVGLTFAMGVVVGRAAEPEPKAEDPLAKLERRTPQSAKSASKAPAEPSVEAANLSFPTALTESEDRPEVLAALQAAAAEVAALDQPELRAPAAAPEQASEASLSGEPCEPIEVDRAQMVASIPAAVAAGPGARSLPKVLKHDSLVAAAMQPEDDAAPAAAHGHSGEFTLQVISYDRPEPSRAFAEGLRKKGHAAFVTAADVPDRGRYYRVRIGPFKNRELAEGYRRKFEDEEHMNTFVVRVKPDEG